MDNELELFGKIAGALLSDYTSIYYVNAKSNAYYAYSHSKMTHNMQLTGSGEDFFAMLEDVANQLVHEEDRHLFVEEMQKPNLLRVLKSGEKERIVYRLVNKGKIVYHSMHLIREVKNGDDYFVLGILDVDGEVHRQIHEKKELERERDIFGGIAESLASYYDMFYFVSINSGSYAVYHVGENSGSMEKKEEGQYFFESAVRNIEILVHPEDSKTVKTFLDRENIKKSLLEKDLKSIDYRVVTGAETRYVRLTLMHASDRVHFLIGMKNISDVVEKKKEEISALKSAQEMASRDELTHAKNKNAYQEVEAQLQSQLEANPQEMAFGIIVCDLNNLKKINDTQGHKAGDRYIRESCQLLFDTFTHSPVFRVGGDEFVVVLRDRDYNSREGLFANLRAQILDNLDRGEGAVAATGMAVYESDRDTRVADVFERADSVMYSDKRRLKERKTESANLGLDHKAIPATLKLRLDQLFETLTVIAEGSYVYLCNMQYDFSRWSSTAVSHFGLPGEYMYGAGAIWAKRVHPQDRNAYQAGIDTVFTGITTFHDLQYRVMDVDGNYDVCTCRGVVVNDMQGKPEYFCGVIRNHGQQGNLDALTGLPNQYSFFEELRKRMQNGTHTHLCMLGIRKFGEINEMYGYRYGNRVIQKFGRFLMEYVGSDGTVFRLDGTRFGLILNILSFKENQGRYEELRELCRKGIAVDGKQIVLELNSGLFKVDDFDISEETIHACLNYAYDESKTRRSGDMVEFLNNLNEENRERVEKLHKIHSSITQDFKGFSLMYQPIIDAKNEALIGAEALLRWSDETTGMVPPDLFIPILEKDPLFAELGEWVLKTALRDAKPFLRLYPEFTVNVNLSYSQLERPDFLDRVFLALEEMAYPPERLCLEITERCRMLDMDLLKNVIVGLRGRGIRVALDDFGTGYSALGIIKDIPFDVIKIDRSFVKNVVKGTKDQAMIEELARIASIFGAKICVEGVENEAIRDTLRSYSIKSFQGYYYAKPLPIERFRSGQWADEETS